MSPKAEFDYSGVWAKKPRKRHKGDLRIGTKDKRKKMMWQTILGAQKKIALEEALKEPEPDLVIKGAL
jgi:hypothetical protein